MDLSQLQTNVNYRRRESNQSFISNDEITYYLNEGLRMVAMEYDWDWTKTSASISHIADTTSYTLSAYAPDLDEPIDLFYANNYNIERVTPENFRRLSANDFNMYAIEADILYISTSFGSANLDFHYYSNWTAQTSGGYALSGLSASTDSPLMPLKYQDCLVDYAVSRCYQKEGMLDDYQIAYNDFKNKLSKMTATLPSRKATALKRFRHINELTTNQYIPQGKDNIFGNL